MSDWVDELLAAVRANKPLACAGCGRLWDRADMLEASLPLYSFELAGEVHTLLTLSWVGGCCAELANPWQPGDPETRR